MAQAETANPMEMEIRFTARQSQAWRALALPATEASWLAQERQAEPIDVLYGGGKGGGKLSPLTAMVYTPFGPKPMGDIRVGDQVSNPDGSVARVIGVWPQGQKDIYRVTFDDGSSTRVGLEHLWCYKVRGKTRFRKRDISDRPTKWLIGTTGQLLAMVEAGERVQIPITRPVEFTVTCRYKRGRWPLDPYVLGVVLGDGHIGPTQITVTSADPEIAAYLPVRSTSSPRGNKAKGYQLDSSVAAGCRKLGLAGKRSWEKFIPEVYKLCSLDMRWSLMQGLMDTDGYADSRGHASYTTTSAQLARDVQWLAWSLGYKAQITSGVPTYRYKGQKKNGRLAYTVWVKGNDHSGLFRLPRKRQRASQPYLGNGINGGSERTRHIASIVQDGREEAQCITVDHPNGLYLTDDFIVTHNSFFLCAFAYLYALEVIRFFDLQPATDVPHIGWIGRKIAQVFTGTTLETWKTLIPSACYKLVAGSEKHPRHILVDDRVAIDYGGLDSRADLERFNSAEYGFIGVDQAEETVEDDVSTLQATRRKRLYHKRLKRWLCLPYRGLWTANPRQCWLKMAFIDGHRPNKIFVPALYRDNPHLPSGYVKTLEDAFGHRPDLLRAYRDGDWSALSGVDQIVLAEWVTAAKMRWSQAPYTKRWVSVDPARFGDDLCVILGGQNTEIVDARVLPYSPEPLIVQESAAMSQRMGDCPIIVEEVGVCGVGDHLAAQGRSVIRYRPAEKAMDSERFYNARAERWSTVAKWMSDGVFDSRGGAVFSLPEPTDDATASAWRRVCEQLLWPRYEFRGQRVLVEAKEDIKSEHNGQSPDFADAYVNGVSHLPSLPIVSRPDEPGYRRQTFSRPAVMHPMGM